MPDLNFGTAQSEQLSLRITQCDFLFVWDNARKKDI